MNWEDLLKHLNDNHFYPGKTLVVKKKETVCDGLYLSCPPILKDSKLKKLREVLPEGFKADYLTNLQEIHITADK